MSAGGGHRAAEPAGSRDGVARTSDGTPDRARPFPFWVLQVAELAVAVVLVDVSVHVRNGGLLVAAAGAFAALAMTAQGPLGLVRICPQRLHLALVVGASVLVAAAPIVPALRPDTEGIIVVEFASIGLIRVATLSRTSEYRPAVRRGPGGRQVIETTASVVEPRPYGGTRSPGTPTVERTARSVGQAAGAAAASGRHLWARHGPAVRTRSKAVVRKAGQWAGRATGPHDGVPPR